MARAARGSTDAGPAQAEPSVDVALSAGRPAPLPEARRWLIAAVVTALGAGLRLALAAWLPLFPDETYYWEWSRHLAPGYFDHPPGIALAIRAGTAMAGVSPIGVRLGPWLAGTLAVAFAIWTAHSLGGSRAAMWTAVIAACLPAAALGLVLATPDALLVTTMAATLACVVRALGHPPGSAAAAGWWLAAGIALGTAMLSKYPAALVAAGVLFGVAARPELRAHLRQPAPYVAAALAVAVTAPMIWWNARHDWVSFRFQLHHGLATAEPGSALGARIASALTREGQYLGGVALLASPILLGLSVAAIWRALRRPAPAPAALLAVVALTWLAAFAASALRHPVEANWPAPALLAATPLVGREVARGWARRWAAPAYGLGVVMLSATVALAAHPIATAHSTRDPVGRAFGWDSLGARVAAMRAADARVMAPGHRVWVAANRYQDASELAFHLPDHPPVFSLNIASRANQYDLWESFASRARPGDDLVLVVGDDRGGAALADVVASHFSERVRGEEVTLRHRPPPASPIARRRMWLMRGWLGA